MTEPYRILALLLATVLLTACSQRVADITNEETLGTEVSVRGTVVDTVKLGDLSGYTLIDGDGDRIAVASEELPTEGSRTRVTGTLRRAPIIGYYIAVE
jgi:hypothetical protein